MQPQNGIAVGVMDHVSERSGVSDVPPVIGPAKLNAGATHEVSFTVR